MLFVVMCSAAAGAGAAIPASTEGAVGAGEVAGAGGAATESTTGTGIGCAAVESRPSSLAASSLAAALPLDPAFGSIVARATVEASVVPFAVELIGVLLWRLVRATPDELQS
jgi:hypothetical protein